MRAALVVLLSLALVGLAEGVVQGLGYLSERRRRALRRRLESPGRARPVADPILLRQGRYSANPALDAWLSGQPWATRLADLLEQADSRRTVAEILAASLALALLGAASGLLVGTAGALVAVGGALLPVLFLRAARERRSRALSEQLPEALDMMARSLRAGHALGSAFRLVASEMPQPIAAEFSRAHEEQQLGLSLARTVRDMAERCPHNADLKMFAVSTVIQAETGGNLAEILDGIARTVRERFHFYGKVNALTAEARISGAFVSAMPLVLALLLAFTQPAYIGRLVDNQLGRAILTAALASWGLGVVWFLRLTRVDF